MKKILVALVMLASVFFLSAQRCGFSKNTLVASSITDNAFVSVTSAGGVYVLYGKSAGRNVKRYLQLIDKNGNKMFGDNGLLISAENTSRTFFVNRQMLVTDKEDNAIAVVCDKRSGDDAMSYTVYKVSPSGEMLWGDAGITFSRGEKVDFVAFMNVSELDDGSFVFSWTVGNDDTHIELERLSASGEFLWSKPLKVENSGYSWLIPSIDNTFNVVYTQNNRYDFAVRRYDADGLPVWTEDVVIYDGGLDRKPAYLSSDFVSDGEGGVFAAYSAFKVQVTHVKSDGSCGFGCSEKGGLPLDDTTNGNTDVRLTYCRDDKCLYACYNERVASKEQLVFQKIDRQGRLLYGNDGKRNEVLAQSEITLRDMAISDEGNFVVVYTYMNDRYSDKRHLCAMRINAEDGTAGWSKGFDVSPDGRHKRNIHCSEILDNNCCFVVWQDGRIEDSVDLFVRPICLKDCLRRLQY